MAQGPLDFHRITRRLFLSEMGRKTAGVAILGSGVLAACSSGGDIAVEDSESTVDAETLRWERVSLGFVSAYVLARGNEVAIVDTGVAGSADAIAAGLSALGADWGDVNNIILTHLHGDHVGSLPEIVALAPQATSHAGRADASRIRGATVEPLDDGDELFGLQVIETPGHTAGHISVLDPGAGLLVAGDAINEDGGMVLGPNERFSDDIAVANASVVRLAERQFETVVFGHGNPIEGGASEAIVALAQTLNA